MICPKPGIYPNVPDAEYRSWDAVSQSFLKRMREPNTPAHLKAFIDGEISQSNDTKSKAFGRASHGMFFEPDTFDERYLEGTMIDPKAKGWQTQLEENPGWDIYPKGSRKRIERICECAKNDPEWRSFLEADGEVELSIVWIDEVTGLLCKLRLDKHIMSPSGTHVIIDAKSSKNAQGHKFEKDAEGFGYGIQTASYIAGAAAAFDCDESDILYRIAAFETEPPWLREIYKPDEMDRFIEHGRTEYRRLLNTYARCLGTGIWPGYTIERIEAMDKAGIEFGASPGTQELSPPDWVKE